MCLDILTTKRTLKKDKKVWKVVVFLCGGEYPAQQYEKFFPGTVTQNDFPFPTPLERKNIAEKRRIHGSLEYDSGYHCFVNKKDAPLLGVNRRVLDYIIPAGTEVQYGRQDGERVVVTPILINPRLAKKGNNK